MIYNIWYNNELMGSVHYFSYDSEKSSENGDVRVKLKSLRSLETLLQLPPQSRLRIGTNHRTSEVRYGVFKNEVLSKTRDIHIEGHPRV